MSTITNSITVFAEDGEPGQPHELTIKLDGSKPDCPVTLYDDEGNAVYSCGNDELHELIDALKQIQLD